MSLLEASNIKKTYGDRTVLDIDYLAISSGQRIGLVGRNGAGKSTLIFILSGELKPDEGKILTNGLMSVIHQGLYPGQFREHVAHPRFENRSFRHAELSPKPSGGELTRESIARALAKEPDILFADEPTTNLDMDGIILLQKELTRFRGGLILVSHDRELLDNVCGSIWEIEAGRLRIFPGNYSSWALQKSRERDFASSEYEAYRREERRLRESARRLNEAARRTTKAPSRMSPSEARICHDKGQIAMATVRGRAKAIIKRADMLEKRERPPDLPEIKMELGSSAPLRSRCAVRGENVSAVFGDRVVLDRISFEVTAGKRTVMIGANGTGKTTLLGMIEHGAPGVSVSPSARVGYFNQNQESLDMERSALENARAISRRQEHEIRVILARLEIKGDDVHKKCGVMSGGERAKVMFARLLASDLNTLILDEPTNHIDVYTAETLEALLASWRGTLLVVTHDRRFAEKIAERVLIMEKGKLLTYEGTFDEYEKNSSLGADDANRELSESMINMRMARAASIMAQSGSETEKRSLKEELAGLERELAKLKERLIYREGPKG